MKIEAYILQGESETPSDNHILGQYSITNITPQDEKEIIVDISYTYDENGMVVMDAIQRKTGKKLTVTKLEATGDMSWMDEEPKQQSVALPTTIYLAIDVSGSMSGEPIKEVGKAANKLCDNIDLTSTKVGVIALVSDVKQTDEVVQISNVNKDNLDWNEINRLPEEYIEKYFAEKVFIFILHIYYIIFFIKNQI